MTIINNCNIAQLPITQEFSQIAIIKMQAPLSGLLKTGCIMAYHYSLCLFDTIEQVCKFFIVFTFMIITFLIFILRGYGF